jgi:uncharacterized repeat protein (TIGR02543 family)
MYRFKTTAHEDSRLLILSSWGAVAFAGLLFWSGAAFGAPVSADTATSAVQGWLHQDRQPLGGQLSAKIKNTEAVKDANGEFLYYVVHLDPSGFVVLPADDLAEPIVAFSATGSFNASSGSAMAALVNRDMPRRMARARAGSRAVSGLKSRVKWRAFLAGSPNPPPDVEENGSIVVASQIRVAPFVQTLWSQTLDASLQDACYNYFTPPGPNGDTNNYPCGCIATALAQEMFYFQYPNTGVGTGRFIITNNGVAQTTQLLGGNGTGGPYQWTNMPLSPNNPNTNQAMAIGYLTHDAGVAINMAYTSNNSASTTYLARQALRNTFKFANAAYYENEGSGITGPDLMNMINPNLDARLPVMLGVEYDGGHSVVCDGYGYSSSTLFHHLNLGFAGDDDIWYALPEVDLVDVNADFTMVEACIYNIYTNGSGQIISGRVTDPTGAPVSGATVTAARSRGGTYTAATDTNGVYALACIPADSTYTLTVTSAGDSSATNKYSTGASVFNVLPSGNVWGANFVLAPPLLAIPETGFASIGPAGGPFSVLSQIHALTNTSASPINWTISNTNNWLSVTSTNGTLAAGGLTNFIIALNSAANSLTNGSYSGSIWITNLNNGVAQQLQFSLSVETADYPIAVTGYNLDVVVENTAVGGNTTNYADIFDPSCSFILPPSPPVCFYEAGLAATDLLGGGSAVLGLPQSGLFTSLADNATTFQFGPYNSGNVLYLTSGAASGPLTLSAPAAYQSLSVLAASAQGGGNGTLVIHFADGTASSAIPFNAANYLTTNTPGPDAAITHFGLLVTGAYNVFGSVDNDTFFPTLYQTSINLHNLGLDTELITSVTFTMPASTNTNTVTGIFALSGTEAPYNYVLTASASPTNGGTVSGGGALQEGSTEMVTATANSGFEFIGWTGDATGTDNPLPVTVNTNLDITANFAEIGTNITVTVITNVNAYGAVTPNLNGRDLKRGRSYTLTATATSGNLFSSWTGSITTNKNPLAFKAESNMVLQANFAPNPFPLVAGTYNGLFFDANNGVAEQTAGMLKGLAIGQKGTYSGTLLINGASHAISGRFDPAGQATNHISRARSQGGLLTVVMTVNGNEPLPQVTGTVFGTNIWGPWTANLIADRAANSLPPAEYTLLIPPTTDHAPASSSPSGYGYALITNHADAANITGALADGAVFNQTAPVSQDGYVPIYANLYAGKGLLLGWINLDLTNTADVGLTWIRPKHASGLYTNGFTDVLPAGQILLSQWTNSPGNFDELTNLSLLETINDTTVGTNLVVNITALGKVTGPLASGAITPKTGVFTVTLGSGPAKVTGHGAILLNAGYGGGYFLTKTTAGAVILAP